MSKNITDIVNWENDYPFLEDVWKSYKNFENTSEADNSLYDFLCSEYILKKLNVEISRYKGFCISLMKNLGHYSTNPNLYKLTNERCHILFNWIYNSIKEQKITNKIINKCFDEYDYEMKIKDNEKNKCHFFQYDKMREPINMTLLDIFNDKMRTIKTTLMDVNISNRARGRKYVCECLNIYKHMNDKYCSKGKEKTEDNLSTCIKLGNFKHSYKFYLYDESDLHTIIPSLDNLDADLLVKCTDKEEKLQLVSKGLGTQESYQEGSPTEDFEGAKPYLGTDTTLGNADNSMRKTITTTIGTFAGASSLLALLYRFTPAGRLVNPKLRRTTGMINNNFYGDDANGMLFDGNEHNGFNSYNIGYEAA